MSKDHKGWTRAKMNSYEYQCANGHRDFDATEWVEMQCKHDEARPPTLWERLVG
jgi:hypothetical protein